MQTYFTSDTHFDHKNIIKYCNRPFQSIEEMNIAIVEKWNELVSSEDIVYHLGDFTFGDIRHFSKWANQLNGTIKILPGSHDHHWLKDFKPSEKVQVIAPLVSIKIPEIKNGKYPQILVMCHYSMQVFDRSHYGSYHIFGHSHGKLKGIGRSMDIGVDTNNFYPYSIWDIHARLSKIPIPMILEKSLEPYFMGDDCESH